MRTNENTSNFIRKLLKTLLHIQLALQSER